MLRVLAITGNAIVGGMENAVLRLAQHLPRDAFSLIALCPFESAFTSSLRSSGVAVHIAPVGEKLRWHSIQRAVELARMHDIEVIHAHMPSAHAVAGLAGRITHTPVVASIHSMHLSMLDFEVHRLAGTHLCVVSEAARAHALAVGAAASRLTVVRNGVDSERFVPRVDDGAGDADRPAVVGYVGRLSEEKNPALFIRVAALVRARLPATRFVVVGDGPLRGELEALAAALDLADALTFAGECTNMPAQYRALDVLVSTSWHEGTPLAVLEAMACAVPVVATDVGGVPELVVPGTTGWLAPPGDEFTLCAHTVELLRAPAARARFGAAARARVRNDFPLDRYVQRMGALLRGVARETPRPRGSAGPRTSQATEARDAASA